MKEKNGMNNHDDEYKIKDKIKMTTILLKIIIRKKKVIKRRGKYIHVIFSPSLFPFSFSLF